MRKLATNIKTGVWAKQKEHLLCKHEKSIYVKNTRNMQGSVTLVKKMKKVHLCILVYFYASKLLFWTLLFNFW